MLDEVMNMRKSWGLLFMDHPIVLSFCFDFMFLLFVHLTADFTHH